MTAVHHRDLRKLAAGRACLIRVPAVCNADPETTVTCHFRMCGISGMGLKSPDAIAAWGCSMCHAYVDSHHDDATRLMFLEGVIRTQAVLISMGVLRW